MKKATYWLCFAGGFVVCFLPFLLLPNAWVFFIGPFLGLYDIVQLAIYGPFIAACVLACCKKKAAAGWVWGSIASVALGFVLFLTTGLSFVPV